MDRRAVKAVDPRESYEQGLALFREGKYREAESFFVELERERPDSKHTMYIRAMCLLAMDRFEEARELHDELCRHKSDTAKKLAAKLGGKIREKALNHQRLSAKLLAKGRTREMEDEDEYEDEYPEPRRVQARHVILVCGGLALIGIAALVVHMGLQPAYEEYAEQTRIAGEPSRPYTVPDEFVDAPVFYPKGDEAAFTVALFLASPEGAPQHGDKGVADQVGAAVAGNWETVKARVTQALAMVSGDTQALGGTPRNEMVRTVVVPRTGTLLSGALAGKEVSSYVPGKATVLSSVVAACGEPDHFEEWGRNAPNVGLKGTTHWWGTIGVAADEDGGITHVLMRGYPKGKP